MQIYLHKNSNGLKNNKCCSYGKINIFVAKVKKTQIKVKSRKRTCNVQYHAQWELGMRKKTKPEVYCLPICMSLCNHICMSTNMLTISLLKQQTCIVYFVGISGSLWKPKYLTWILKIRPV